MRNDPEDFFNLNPQLGHIEASELICLAHSWQLIKAI
jgi:hypothetical protein